MLPSPRQVLRPPPDVATPGCATWLTLPCSGPLTRKSSAGPLSQLDYFGCLYAAFPGLPFHAFPDSPRPVCVLLHPQLSPYSLFLQAVLENAGRPHFSCHPRYCPWEVSRYLMVPSTIHRLLGSRSLTPSLELQIRLLSSLPDLCLG